MSGRTVWQAQDAAWWHREWIVDLGEEFGSAGPACINWLECEAKAQNNSGYVKAGFKTLARGVFADLVTVRNAVSRAVTLTLLVEFEEDAGIFKCLISWWHADQEKALGAARVARHRKGLTEVVTVGNGESRSVTSTGQDSTEQKNSLKALSATPTDVQTVFDAWLLSTGKTSRTLLSGERRKKIVNALKLYPLDEVLDAVDGWKFSPHHRGENERGTVYNDLELLLKSSKHLENFRDLKRSGGTVVQIRGPRGKSGPSDMWNAINGGAA